jgi:hypothetical protein
LRERDVTGKEEPSAQAGDAEERDTELHRRLRALKWPTPPLGARERGLEALRTHLEERGPTSNDDGQHEAPDED